MFVKLLLLVFFAFVNANPPEVTIDQGTLRGVEEKTWNDKIFNSFTGIPYAQPPIGELRFKPPVPAEPWKDVLDASKPTPMCPQINIYTGDYTPLGQEDCLYLNVYTPRLPREDDKPMPVLFFIHGGGFMNGKSDYYGPKILQDKDVVLVSINYRLGTLGFLSTGDLVVPGNNGLKDQSLALKWVKKNIAHFGGDPTKITIFGQSAGGASVHYHMLSPLSKGLFHGVIAQSGMALGPWALGTKENKRNTKRLAEFLDCPTGSSQEIVDCLKKIDALKIVAQDSKFFEWTYDPMVIFKPVVEFEHEGAFISEHPVEIIKSGKAAKVPFMIGLTSQDGAIKSASIYNDSKLVKELDEEFNRIALMSLLCRESSPNKEVTEKIRKFYFGDKHIDDSAKDEVTKMYTDFLVFVPTESTVRMHYKYSNNPVYYYLFNYRGSESFAKVAGDTEHEYGVCHSDDLLYLVDMVFFPDYQPTDADKEMTEKITAMWVNFATTGNPTPDDDSRFPEKWRPVQSDFLEYYKIKSGSDMTMGDHLFKKRSDFLKSLPLDGTKTRNTDEL